MRFFNERPTLIYDNISTENPSISLQLEYTTLSSMEDTELTQKINKIQEVSASFLEEKFKFVGKFFVDQTNDQISSLK